MVILDVALFDNGLSKWLAFAILHVVILFAHVHFKPMRRALDNSLITLSLFVLVLISLVLLRFQPPIDDGRVLVLLNVLTLNPVAIVGINYIMHIARMRGVTEKLGQCLPRRRVTRSTSSDGMPKSSSTAASFGGALTSVSAYGETSASAVTRTQQEVELPEIEHSDESDVDDVALETMPRGV